MTFFQRFLSLARADAHGVLDSLEDRGLVLRQCLRDAELEVARKRARLEELDGSLEMLARHREQLADRLRTLDDDVRLALTREQEELARFAVRRVLSVRKQLERGEVHAREAREERAKLADKLALQQRELEELRDRVRDALAEERAAQTREWHECDPAAEPAGFAVRDEEVELELLRRRSAPVQS
jgi:phage shock protein A